MDAPFVAAVGTCVGRIAVGGKITRDKIGFAAVFMCEVDIETIVQKRIGLGRFAGLGAIEC